MPLLAYCVSLSGGDAALTAGEIQQFESTGLRCYYGRVEDFAENPQKTAETALVFHRVNMALFEALPVLPFRFPTLAKSVDELQSQVAEQSVRLRNALDRLGSRVQMEITISANEDGSVVAKTGTEYLRAIQARDQRLHAAVQAVQVAGSKFANAWKEQARDRQVRVLALLERGTQQAFSQELAIIALPDGVECRVVGPWPPTEFIEE
jgi:hypothetical protein